MCRNNFVTLTCLFVFYIPWKPGLQWWRDVMLASSHSFLKFDNIQYIKQSGICFFLVSLGEYSYLGTTLRHADIEPMPSLSDVRQLIALYGILPLGECNQLWLVRPSQLCSPLLMSSYKCSKTSGHCLLLLWWCHYYEICCSGLRKKEKVYPS